MTNRQFFYRDREVITNLCLKNDCKVITIAIFEDRDLAIARSSVKTRMKIIKYKTTQNHTKLQNII